MVMYTYTLTSHTSTPNQNKTQPIHPHTSPFIPKPTNNQHPLTGFRPGLLGGVPLRPPPRRPRAQAGPHQQWQWPRQRRTRGHFALGPGWLCPVRGRRADRGAGGGTEEAGGRAAGCVRA